MNSDQLKGKWKQIKGSAKERWGKLTDDDLDVIDGQTEQLVGTIQERYGIARDAAQKQVDEWNANAARESEREPEVDEKGELERRKAS
jgi:uncharacterized protein YjbJ (UPF0337 family)